MQLNPHFLFKTFNSVSSLMLSDPVADENAERLSRLFRITLAEGAAQRFPCHEEMEVVSTLRLDPHVSSEIE